MSRPAVGITASLEEMTSGDWIELDGRRAGQLLRPRSSAPAGGRCCCRPTRPTPPTPDESSSASTRCSSPARRATSTRPPTAPSRHPKTAPVARARRFELGARAAPPRARPARAGHLPGDAGAQRRASAARSSSTCPTSSATTTTPGRPACSPSTTCGSSPGSLAARAVGAEAPGQGLPPPGRARGGRRPARHRRGPAATAWSRRSSGRRRVRPRRALAPRGGREQPGDRRPGGSRENPQVAEVSLTFIGRPA